MGKIGGLALLIIVLIFFLVLIFDAKSNTQCAKEDDARDEYIKGKIVGIYLDSNHHNYETLEIQSETGLQKTYILLFEKSGIFNHLQLEDSIFKEKGSLSMRIYRENNIDFFELNYGCIRTEK